VELNPLRAGLTSDLSGYRWSSYGANAQGAQDSLITPHELYESLGLVATSRRVAYRAMVDLPLDEDCVQAIRQATKGGWALGRESIRQQVACLKKGQKMEREQRV
jgi:putative transposase